MLLSQSLGLENQLFVVLDVYFIEWHLVLKDDELVLLAGQITSVSRPEQERKERSAIDLLLLHLVGLFCLFLSEAKCFAGIALRAPTATSST